LRKPYKRRSAAWYPYLFATALSGLPLVTAQAADAKWGPLIDFSGKVGETRRIGEADLFLPVAQDERRLLFLDIRSNFDNLDQREGNFGLGYRAMQDEGWNFGLYGFFDRRRSTEHNYFSQITTGIEALGQDFDARANVYLPIGQKSYEVENSARVDLTGGSIQILSGIERAYHGGDAELGWRVPLFAPESSAELRVYGGGYWFDAEASESVAGPRGRLEFRLFDPIEALPGTRVTLSGELQRDEARGTQHFLGLKLRIPLQAETARPLTPQERRMTDPLIRDVDIVTQSATISEKATFGGQTLSGVTAITDGATAQSVIDGAASNALLVLNGTATVSSQITLRQGQTLSSGGSVITLTGASSGRAVSFALPGGTGSLRGAVAGTSVLALSSNSTLSGLTVENTSTANDSTAVSSSGTSGARISGATLRSAKGAALSLNNAASASVENTTISASGLSSNAVTISSSNNASFTGNTITASGWHSNGFDISGSTGLALSNNTISASGLGSIALRVDQSSGSVTGNTLSTSGNGDGTNNSYVAWITQGGGSTFANNTLTSTGKYATAFYIDNSASITLRGNTTNTSGFASRGIHITNSASATIADNRLTTTDVTASVGFYTSAVALFLESSSNSTIQGNTLSAKGVSAPGMNLRGSSGLTVTGNTVTTTGEYGIGIIMTNSTDATVTSNTIRTSGANAHGIQVYLNSHNATVRDNTATSTGTSAAAVNVSNANDASVTGNKLNGNGNATGNAAVTSTNAANLTVSGNTP